MRIYVLSKLRDAGSKQTARLTAIAMELNVCQVAVSPFQRFHCLQRSLPVAGDTQIIAVDMHSVWQMQLHACFRQRLDDPAWRHAETGYFVIKAMSVPAEFPELHSARMTSFTA